MRRQADSKGEPRSKVKAAARGPHLHKMLAHPLRHQIVIRLSEAPASTVQLASDLGESEERIREQLKVLRKNGPGEPAVVELLDVQPGPRGGNRYIYGAAAVALDSEEWEDLGPLEQATSTATILKKLWSEVAASMTSALFYRHPMHHLTRYAVTVDQKGAEEINALLIAAKEGIEEVGHRSADRRAMTGESPQRFITALKSFPAAQNDAE